MKKAIFLYFIIFIEGYVVLSTELLAIRQITPYVGAGTDTTSIIIAAVLLPLALGYYVGGKFKPKLGLMGKRITIRRKLLQNIFISTIFLIFGLSFVFVHDFFELFFISVHHNSRLNTFIYAMVFIVFPVFLLAQTIPLTSNLFKEQKLSTITGKMLFFSTLGSLMGATFSTLVLMATIGVNLTVTVTIFCLCFLYILLSKRLISKQIIAIILLASASLYINSDTVMKKSNIVQSNNYHTIQITENKNGKRLMKLNGHYSAGLNKNESLPFGYMKFFENNFIRPIQNKGEVKSILVIGSGGFTLGLQDKKNNYAFVDIDGDLKDISEQYFLKQKLGENKKFHVIPARGFLQQAISKNQKYDLIIIDTFLGVKIPEHLITKEFYETVKLSLKDNGIVAINIIASPTFNNAFSVNLDNTLNEVFPNINRDVVGNYNAWISRPQTVRNIVYSYFNKKYDEEPAIYIDDKASPYYDKTKPID